MTINKTHNEIFVFIKITGLFMADADKDKKEYAAKELIQQTLKGLSDVVEAYNKKIMKLRINNCAKDSDNCLLRDERGNFKFTAEQQIVLNDEIELLDKTIVPISVEFTEKVLKGLKPEFLKYYTEFIKK